MVAAVRQGRSLREVARQFGVGVATVAFWVQRAQDLRLDRVDWTDRSSAPHHPRRTDTSLEELVLQIRRELADSDLGAVYGDFIAVTPLHLNLTEEAALKALRAALAK